MRSSCCGFEKLCLSMKSSGGSLRELAIISTASLYTHAYIHIATVRNQNHCCSDSNHYITASNMKASNMATHMNVYSHQHQVKQPRYLTWNMFGSSNRTKQYPLVISSHVNQKKSLWQYHIRNGCIG